MKVRLTMAICFMLVLLVSLGAIASLASEPPSLDTPGESTLSESDAGRVVDLQPTDLLVLRLEGNPSTGYGWRVQEMDRGVLRPMPGEEFEPQSDLPGAPGIQTLRFAGVTRGQTDLRLVYQRPWERDAAPAKTFSVQVRSQGRFKGAYTPVPSPANAATSLGAPSATQELPPYYNWCDLGGCSQVKNQGQCGSCWAFATVGPLESNILIRDGVEKDLSEQYLVSCNSDGWSCGGGWWAHDYHEWKYITGEPGAGARYEVDFPYTASNAPCNPPHTPREKIATWGVLASGVAPVDAIKQAILDHGPVTVGVCANSAFQSYGSGVFTGPGCSSVNHGVVLVGWDDNLGAWRLRNSWGSGWGESGYMWIQYGVSQVGYRTAYVDYPGGANQPPVASFGYTCDGLTCDFDASASYDADGTIVSYDWDFGESGTGSGVTPQHTYAAPGTYTVLLTVTDDDDATGTDSQSVSVSESTAMHVAVLADGRTVVNKFWKATVTITVHDEQDSPVANATVGGAWGGGASGTGACLTGSTGQCSVTSGKVNRAEPSVTFAVTGLSHAALAYDAGANVETIITVYQTGGNQPPQASFGYTCDGLACNFDAGLSNDPDGTIVSYSWDFGDGSGGMGAETDHTYDAADTYDVVLTVTDDGGATGTETKSVPVGVDPPALFVDSIAMSGKKAGPNLSATAVVTVLDATSLEPVAGAEVQGTWSGGYVGPAGGITGAGGTVTFVSGKWRGSSAIFTFTVDDVIMSGYAFDATRGETSASITVPPSP